MELWVQVQDFLKYQYDAEGGLSLGTLVFKFRATTFPQGPRNRVSCPGILTFLPAALNFNHLSHPVFLSVPTLHPTARPVSTAVNSIQSPISMATNLA
jgi:hypothetical protein